MVTAAFFRKPYKKIGPRSCKRRSWSSRATMLALHFGQRAEPGGRCVHRRGVPPDHCVPGTSSLTSPGCKAKAACSIGPGSSRCWNQIVLTRPRPSARAFNSIRVDPFD